MTQGDERFSIDCGDVVFTHSPFIFEVRSLDDSPITEVTVIVFYGDDFEYDYTETIEVNQKIEFRRDLSSVFAALFGREDLWENGTAKTMGLQIRAKNSNNKSFDFEENLTVIYGSIEPFGLYFEGEKKVKMWKRYPFSVPFFLNESVNETLVAGLDENLALVKTIANIPPNQRGIFDVDLTPSDLKGVYCVSSKACMIYAILPFCAVLKNKTTRYIVELSDCKSGVYLGWINAQGGKDYFLFKQIGESLKVSESTFTSIPTYDSYLYDRGNRQNKTAQRILTLGLSKAESETYNYVEGVLLSPFVYLYNTDEGAWVRVEVEAGDFVKPSSELKDLQFKIRLPELNTVKL